MKDTMDIINLIISDPLMGFIIVLQLALMGLVIGGSLALLIWAVVAIIRWGTRGRHIKVPGVEMSDGAPAEAPPPEAPTPPAEEPVTLDRRKTDLRCARHAEIDESIDGLIEFRRKTESKIMSAQLRSINESADAFDDLTAKWPGDSGEKFWNRFDRVLLVSAIENHILAHVDVVDDEIRIHDDYLEDKMLLLSQAYRRMVNKDQGLPDWLEVETRVALILRVALDRFAKIAHSEWGSFRRAVDVTMTLIGAEHPAVSKRLSRLLVDAWD